MTEVICSVIAGAATVCCGIITLQSNKCSKAMVVSQKRVSQQMEESRLSLRLMDANCSLTVGVALALKNNHCNGEVEDGLNSVRKAQDEYTAFMAGLAIEHLAS